MATAGATKMVLAETGKVSHSDIAPIEFRFNVGREIASRAIHGRMTWVIAAPIRFLP